MKVRLILSWAEVPKILTAKRKISLRCLKKHPLQLHNSLCWASGLASRVNTHSECANNDSACEREIMTNDINENISDIYADDCFPDFFFHTHIVPLFTKQISLLNYCSINLYFLFPRELDKLHKGEKSQLIKNMKMDNKQESHFLHCRS